MLLEWLESTALSSWLRESEALWALPGILFMHTLAMGFLAGSSVVLCLRALGVAGAIPAAALRDFLPLLRPAIWLTALSGILLLIAYPTKALTNPVFYLKLAAIALAIGTWQSVLRGIYTGDETITTRHAAALRAWALGSMVGWLGAIVLGRLMAYTYTRMMAGEP